MRHERDGDGGSGEFATFRIIPVLVSYGGEDMDDDTGYGWRPYKCPFHGDSSASASVNTTTQVFNCHAGDCPNGSATQVIMKAEGIDYKGALERAEEISGASDTPVRRASGRRGRMAGGSRSGSGTRSFKRTWRSS